MSLFKHFIYFLCYKIWVCEVDEIIAFYFYLHFTQ